MKGGTDDLFSCSLLFSSQGIVVLDFMLIIARRTRSTSRTIDELCS